MSNNSIEDDCILFHNEQRFSKPTQIFVDEGKIAYNSLYVEKMHFHDFFELEFIVDGNATQNLNGVTYPLKKGVLYLLTMNDLHKYCFEENEFANYVSIQFGGEFVSKETVECIYNCKKPIVVDVKNEFDYFYTLFKNLKSLNGCGDAVSVNLMRSILETVCLSAVRKIEKLSVAPKKSVASEIISYINNNYRKHLTVQSLAQQFDLSPNYLGQLFLREMGMTVSQYIKRCRLSMAANLIVNSNLNFNSIAYEVGFLSPYVFSREFKKLFRISPKEYKAKSKIQ